MSFVKGDTVIYTPSNPTAVPSNLTSGKNYQVTRSSGAGSRFVKIIGDDGCDVHVKASCLKRVHIPQRLQAASPAFKAQYGGNPHGQHPITKVISDMVEAVVDDYEERKANERVTSKGLFNTGDILIYRDGTPTNEARTVTHCTATCVWFEETYSMPFNPIEFTKEGYDDE